MLKLMLGTAAVTSGAIVGMRMGLFGKNRVVFDRVMKVEGTEIQQTRPLWCNAFLFEAVAGTFYTENTVKASNGYWISRLYFRPLEFVFREPDGSCLMWQRHREAGPCVFFDDFYNLNKVQYSAEYYDSQLAHCYEPTTEASFQPKGFVQFNPQKDIFIFTEPTVVSLNGLINRL